MAFTDNPIISGLMQQTGLNDLLANSGAAPGSPIGAVSSQNAPHSPAAIPEYRVARPPVNPRFAGPQGGGSGGGFHSPAAQQGMMSAATLQSSPVHDLLGYYGVSAPANIDDHLFIHDPKAFAKHPLIAGAIEQGLGGLANYHPGRDAAETISNIAGSVAGNAAEHQQAYNARAMAPILQAQQIGNLMENKQRMDLQASQEAFQNAHQRWYEGQFDNAQQLAGSKAELQSAQAELAHAKAKGVDNTPAGLMAANYHAQLTALGGGDESKVDPKVANDLWNTMLQEGSKAQAAGKVLVQDDKNKGAVATQQVRNAGKVGKGAGKLDPGSAATDKDLVNQLKDVTGRYQFLDGLSRMDSNHRFLAMTDPKNAKYGVGEGSDEAIETQKQALSQHAAQLHNQRASVYARHGMTYGVDSAPPTAAVTGGAPAAPGKNPFR